MSEKKKEEFQSFQIGNLMGPGALGGMPIAPSKPAVSQPTTPSPQPSAPQGEEGEKEGSENFPFLSALIEQEDEAILAFGEEMGEVYKKLEELAQKRSGKIKEQVLKAIRAYDLTFDLIDYLRQVKANLVSGGQNESAEE